MPLPEHILITPESIGTYLKPVEIGIFKRVIVTENISAAGFTTAVPPASPQVDHGISLDPVTHKVTFKDPVVGAVVMEGSLNVGGIFTPEGHINLNNQAYFINGDGLVNKGMTVTTAGKVVCKQGIQIVGAGTVSTTFNVTGFLIANGGIKLNGSNISDDGGLLDGISIDGAGHVTCHKNLHVNSLITSSQISTTGDIQSDTFIDANTGFKKGGTAGWSGIIDLAVDNTVTVTGGIITAKT